MELDKLLELYLILSKNQREHLFDSRSHQEADILRYVEQRIYNEVKPEVCATGATAPEVAKKPYTGPGIMGRAI